MYYSYRTYAPVGNSSSRQRPHTQLSGFPKLTVVVSKRLLINLFEHLLLKISISPRSRALLSGFVRGTDDPLISCRTLLGMASNTTECSLGVIGNLNLLINSSYLSNCSHQQLPLCYRLNRVEFNARCGNNYEFMSGTWRRHRFFRRNVSLEKQVSPWLVVGSHVTISQAEFPRQLEAERFRRIVSRLKLSE